ncbi:hypothetical protein, partial [Geothermobacter ehrlichii]|uniref:hypothetical protein n=1 Tax=Geothermobacter ehrlichii TaxID=213224 RepID=UPI001CA35393
MPAAGVRPFSASSFGPAKEDGVVRGRNPGSTSIDRKVATHQKQNRRVAPRQAPYFFQREKSKQKRLFLF